MRSFKAVLLSKFILPKIQKQYFTVKGDVSDLKEIDYEIPDSIKFCCEVKKTIYQGRKIFILNDNTESKTTVFYFHGGGFVLEFFSSQWNFVNDIIKKSNVRVIAIDYRLIPFGNYNDAFNLIIPFYKEYIDKHDENIAFMGDSAGGNLSTTLYYELLKQNIPLPKQMILISPWVDLSSTNPDIDKYIKKDTLLTKKGLLLAGRTWSKGIDIKDDKVSPLYGDIKNINNTIMFYGDHDLLYPDGKLFADELVKNPSNHVYFKKGMNHVYPLYPIREAKEARKIIVDYLKNR